MKILILEDDFSLNKGLSFKLKKEGHEIYSSSTIKKAKDIFKENNIDLVICDLNLEDGEGFEFCEDIRRFSDVYILFLTAREDEISMVTAYDLGADDYIIKPFSLLVLISKVKAIEKRLKNNEENLDEKLISGKIIFSLKEMKVFKTDEIILSRSEIKLLKYFLDNPKQIITKEQLLKKLWDIDENFIDENTIAVNIRRLRQKVEDEPSNPKYIKNIRGIGYIWDMGVAKQ